MIGILDLSLGPWMISISYCKIYLRVMHNRNTMLTLCGKWIRGTMVAETIP